MQEIHIFEHVQSEPSIISALLNMHALCIHVHLLSSIFSLLYHGVLHMPHVPFHIKNRQGVKNDFM